MKDGEELVEQPFRRLIDAAPAASPIRYDGFWACMDTFKETHLPRPGVHQGHGAWEVWRPR